jgi:hypothetical protein
MQRVSDRQKTLAAHGVPMSDARLAIETLDMRRFMAVEGRILVHGQDEQSGQNYLILEGTDAKVHFIYYTPKWKMPAAAAGCERITLYGYRSSQLLVGRLWTCAISAMQNSC